MMRLLEPYHPAFPSTLVYMLQKSEYQSGEYLRWLWRTGRFSQVAKRSTLDYTTAAKTLLATAWWVLLAILLIGAALIVEGWGEVTERGRVNIGILVILAYPILLAHLILFPNWLGRVLIINPARLHQKHKATQIFSGHQGRRIAVAGSFGKTSMKEILATVLSEGSKVAATEGNLNTATAHYRFAKSLQGDEEVLIVEYGEYRPGDITGFNDVFQPHVGIITGLNEAHLVNFRTLDRSATNLLSLCQYVRSRHCYVNGESEKLLYYCHPRSIKYDRGGVADWSVHQIHNDLNGLKFTMRDGRRKIQLTSQLVGRHHVGPLALSVVLADSLGLSAKQIVAGVAKTKPFEHRLQPVQRQDGIIVIDDTYNGSPDGMRVGLELLQELSARRKIYVTPGLVELGPATKEAHLELGKVIATSADVVVLMQNSATKYLRQGLNKAGFKGELMIVDDPASFYDHLERVAASGDLVMLQNDWADNYA